MLITGFKIWHNHGNNLGIFWDILLTWVSQNTRRFQHGEGPGRSLLCDYETSNFAKVRFQLYHCLCCCVCTPPHSPPQPQLVGGVGVARISLHHHARHPRLATSDHAPSHQSSSAVTRHGEQVEASESGAFFIPSRVGLHGFSGPQHRRRCRCPHRQWRLWPQHGLHHFKVKPGAGAQQWAAARAPELIITGLLCACTWIMNINDRRHCAARERSLVHMNNFSVVPKRVKSDPNYTFLTARCSLCALW